MWCNGLQWQSDTGHRPGVVTSVAIMTHARTIQILSSSNAPTSSPLDPPWYWCRTDYAGQYLRRSLYWPCKIHYICMHYLTYFLLLVFEPHSCACIYRHKVNWHFFFIYHHLFRPRNSSNNDRVFFIFFFLLDNYWALNDTQKMNTTFVPQSVNVIRCRAVKW